MMMRTVSEEPGDWVADKIRPGGRSDVISFQDPGKSLICGRRVHLLLNLLDQYSSASVWHEKEGAWHEIMPGVRRRILTHASTGMMVYYKIESGKVFALHNHPHAQFGVVLDGGGTFKIGESEWEIGPGDGYYIPPGVFHELRTEGEKPSILIDFFTPERDDYLAEALDSDVA